MPDIERKSVSASQAAALLDASPYITRWMLYRWLKYGDGIDSPAHNRMDWGLRMEPLCLAAAAEDLVYEVIPTRGADGTQPYVRNDLLGCTRDAEVVCPDRGRGALETKAVFDTRVWMDDWKGGKAVPRHIEIQLQTQMLVGDGENSYGWGMVSAWHAGEQTYFQRKPIDALWQKLRAEAKQLFDDIAADKEPDPMGTGVELDLLEEAFPTVIGKTLDLSDPSNAEYNEVIKIAEQVRMMEWHSKERLGHGRAEKDLKARLMAFAKDNDFVRLPHGINFKIKEHARAGYTVKPTTYRTLDAYVPETIADRILDDAAKVDLGG